MWPLRRPVTVPSVSPRRSLCRHACICPAEGMLYKQLQKHHRGYVCVYVCMCVYICVVDLSVSLLQRKSGFAMFQSVDFDGTNLLFSDRSTTLINASGAQHTG